MIKGVIPEFKAGTEAALRAVVTMNGKYSVSEGSKKFGLACGKLHIPRVLHQCINVFPSCYFSNATDITGSLIWYAW